MHNISLNGSLRMMYHLHNEDDVSPLAHYIGSMILQTVAVRWFPRTPSRPTSRAGETLPNSQIPGHFEESYEDGLEEESGSKLSGLDPCGISRAVHWIAYIKHIVLVYESIHYRSL